MARRTWIGGAAKVTQVDNVAPGTVNSGDTFTLTLSSEPKRDATKLTSAVAFVATGVDTAASVAAALVGLIAAEPNSSLFSRITVVDKSGVDASLDIVALISGTPFHLVATASGLSSVVQTPTTASSGPSDLNTAANYAAGVVFADGDDLIIASGSDSILHGLDQTAKRPANVYAGPDHLGTIGDPSANGGLGAYLCLNTGGSATNLEVNHGGGGLLIFGKFGEVRVRGGRSSAEILRIRASTCDEFLVLGPVAANGAKVIVHSGSTVSNLRAVQAVGVQLTIEESVTIDGEIYNDSMVVECYAGMSSASATLTGNGGLWRQRKGALQNVLWLAGVLEPRQDEDVAGVWDIYGGLVDWEKSPAKDVTVSGTINQYGGEWRAQKSPVTISGTHNRYGGSASDPV